LSNITTWSRAMARSQSIDLTRVLSTLIPDSLLESSARAANLVLRNRKLDVIALFWTLVLGFADAKKRKLSALRRSYEARTGVTVVPSSFYDWLTPRLVAYFKRVLMQLLPQ